VSYAGNRSQPSQQPTVRGVSGPRPLGGGSPWDPTQQLLGTAGALPTESFRVVDEVVNFD
jgi:hypothetical protein